MVLLSGSPKSLQPGLGQRCTISVYTAARETSVSCRDVSTGKCSWDMSLSLPRASDSEGDRQTDRQTKAGREEAREKESNHILYDPVSESTTDISTSPHSLFRLYTNEPAHQRQWEVGFSVLAVTYSYLFIHWAALGLSCGAHAGSS